MIIRDTLVFKTLLAIARQRADYDETRCNALLGLLAAADAVRATTRHRLHAIGLTEHQFGTLVVLRALDPEPVLPTTLASHTDTSRAAMTDIIDNLLARTLVGRQRSRQDRRNYLITLTDPGRRLADRAETVVLQALTRLSRNLHDTEPRRLAELCQQFSAPPAAPESAAPTTSKTAITPRLLP